MSSIGFIGASGLMGHGIARNLQAKGHELHLTVHRDRTRIADLLAAGAREQPTPAASRSAMRVRARCTVRCSSWPLACRVRAMPWPMRPDAPMNPMLDMQNS